MRVLFVFAVVAGVFASVAGPLGGGAVAQSPRLPRGLTAVRGIKVGHFTLTERPTGCTVVLAERGAVAGVDVRGASPGTRETDLLNPVNAVEQVHAVVIAGGSAFGLDAASGVVRYLDEKGVGFKIGRATVPIVPAAILIDLEVGASEKIRPTAECGYRAAQSATDGEVQGTIDGNVGAGAGATVGKLAGFGRGMKGGLAEASITIPTGLTVAALVAVNTVGDVIDPESGRVIAGVRTPDGSAIEDIKALVRSGTRPRGAVGGNTTLGIVVTNATLTKAQATKVAQMAQDGYARVIYPSHTMFDGDTIFALATGESRAETGATTVADVSTIGALAADMVSEAIVRAVRSATSIPGYPAARDMAPR
jgi:L-aminopeptidase/D-esterase-like protein